MPGTWDYVQGQTTFGVDNTTPPKIKTCWLATTWVRPKDNGLFMNLTQPNAPTVRLSNLKDGAGTTLMLSENVQKNVNYNWMGVSETQAGAATIWHGLGRADERHNADVLSE